MPHWTIRPATDRDREAIVALWHQGWHDAHRHLVPPEILAYRQPEHFSLWLDECIDAAVVGCDTGAILGFYSLSGAEIGRFYVARAARGTGLAAALMDHAEQTLADGGAEMGELCCTDGNDRARAFYERQGWTLAERNMDNLWLPGGRPSDRQVPTRRYVKRLRYRGARPMPDRSGPQSAKT